MPLSSEESKQLNFRIESLERLVTKQLARHSQYPIKGGGAEIIRFKIVTASCVLKTATGTVESRPCGKSTVTGEDSYRIVNLIDPIGDQLVGDPNDLIGLEGWAAYMEDDYDETCDWEIWRIECDANACIP